MSKLMTALCRFIICYTWLNHLVFAHCYAVLDCIWEDDTSSLLELMLRPVRGQSIWLIPSSDKQPPPPPLIIYLGPVFINRGVNRLCVSVFGVFGDC
jgi:hypothetical protein